MSTAAPLRLLAFALLGLAVIAAQPAAARPDLNPYAPGSIVIDTGGRSLYYIARPGQALQYTIAVGEEGKQWAGRTHVRAKTVYPGWTPTARMRRENPRLPAYVPPGRSNPMGERAIYLATGLLRIHGTNAPRSIGRAASNGCFRMHNGDVVDLYDRVRVGAPVYVLR